MSERLLPILLHAHCPPSTHLAGDDRLPFESQRFELVFDCLLPLVTLLDAWAAEDLPVSLTLSLSPALLVELTSETSQAELSAGLERASQLAKRETERLQATPVFDTAAQLLVDRLFRMASLYRERCGRNPLLPLAEHAAAGRLELVSSPPAQALTSAGLAPEVVALHLLAAQQSLAPWLKAGPRGLWLPGTTTLGPITNALAASGVDWVAVGAPAPSTGPRPPAQPQDRPGPNVFVAESTAPSRIWALSREGRPLRRPLSSAPALDPADVSPLAATANWTARRVPHLHAAGPPGLPPIPYAPEAAAEHAALAAQTWLTELAARGPDSATAAALPLVALDLRLFGGWWFEGPAFLDALARGARPAGFRLSAVGDLLALPAAQAPPEPLGSRTRSRRWVGGATASVFRRLEVAQQRAYPLLERADQMRTWDRRALAQALRELLFAQSSDWPALIAAGTAVDAAEAQLAGHLRSCHDLLDAVERGDVDRDALRGAETRYPIWPRADVLLPRRSP